MFNNGRQARFVQSHPSGAVRQFRMEPVERRMLQSVSTWSGSSISELTGSVFGQAIFGDNGDQWGYATGTAGLGVTEHVSLFSTWDADYSNGIDSGWRDVSLSVNASNNGLASFAFAQADSGTFAVGTSASFHSVTLRAAVADSGMRMAWANVHIGFCRNGSMGESFTIDNIIADTMSASGHTPFESGVVVTATGSGYNGVIISGSVKLQTAQGVYPGPSDLFGQIFVS